jgi:16S rRNA (uracil1498-N3)-methyltransferase
MNSLVVFHDEGWLSGRIVLNEARAKALFYSEPHQVGDEIRVALFGGDKGVARIAEFSATRIELEIIQTEPSLDLRPIDLVVGLSRPQTTKKVIQAAVMAGVRSLHLVRLDSGEPSYLDSHILRPDELRLEISKSLEQICEGRYPEIQVHRSFFKFIHEREDLIKDVPDKLRVMAHSGGSSLNTSQISDYSSLLIAVGSEGGWSEREVAKLESLGFLRVGLGQRVVRVEVALLYLLGQTLGFADTGIMS